MFLQILRSFLGPFTAVLDFFATRTEWLVLLFTVYLCTFAAGSWQLRAIKRRTHDLIDERCKRWLEDHPGASDENLFAYFYPLWEDELKKCGYVFILNKYDLLPVSVTPRHVLDKIVLTPAYLRQYINTGEVAPDKQLKVLERSQRGRKGNASH